MKSEEAIETAKCMKESLETGNIIEPKTQSVLMENKVLEKIEKVGNTYIFETYEKPSRQQIKALEQENKELKEQLAIREKALELACINIIHYEGDDEEEFCAEIDNAENYFIEQAKESMK